MGLRELEDVITNMESITEDFKNYQDVYKELADLQEKVANSLEALKGNKDSLDNLNKDVTINIEKLREKFEELNRLFPEKMLELLNCSKDLQLDFKNKHEDLRKCITDKSVELSEKVEGFSTSIYMLYPFFIAILIINVLICLKCFNVL